MTETALATTTTTEIDAAILNQVLVEGNIESLSNEQRLEYYRRVCESVGLNPLTKPFAYIKLNNKLTLYATKDATDQIRKTRNVSIVDMQAEQIGDLFRVQVKAQDTTGRTEISTGVVSIAGLKGDQLANAMMKAETKAKRRVTLSLCGLGMLDESEVESIPASRVQFVELEDVTPDSQFDPAEAEPISPDAIGAITDLARSIKLSDDMLRDEIEGMFGKASLSELTINEGRALYLAIQKMRDGK